MKCHPAILAAPLLLFGILWASCGPGELVVEVVQPEPQAPKEWPAGYDDRDCNGETPLQPGVPGSPGHLIVSPRNPNGDSELSVLMRQFVDDLREARVLLEAGQPVKPLFPVHRKMRCAWPTRPDERSPRFDSLAVNYLYLVRAYDAAPGRDTYNGVIQGCISCHAASCGGPLDFIDGMKWQ